MPGSEGPDGTGRDGKGRAGGRRRGADGAFPLPAGLLEIRAVAVRTVAIKGVQSSRYLCMDEAGRLHGQVSPRPRMVERGGRGRGGVFVSAAASKRGFGASLPFRCGSVIPGTGTAREAAGIVRG